QSSPSFRVSKRNLYNSTRQLLLCQIATAHLSATLKLLTNVYIGRRTSASAFTPTDIARGRGWASFAPRTQRAFVHI
ncbi:MAG: hypothetical protein V3T84_10150, partial [Phycisphaerales bacterium]